MSKLPADAEKTGANPRFRGKPGLSRDRRRMYDYNQRQAMGSWADEMAVDERADEIADSRMASGRNADAAVKRINARASRRPRPAKGGKPQQAEGVKSLEERLKGATITPPRDELMWDEGPYGGTAPVHQQYSQNFDFSTLPDILQATFNEYEVHNNRVRREMPYAVYQHAMQEVVNVYMIDKVKRENADVEFAEECNPVDILPKDMEIPAMLGEYLQTVSQTVTPTGDKVYVNLPNAVRPQPAVNGVESGHFGVCNAAEHNKYEVALSPIVTKALVERTAEANRNQQQAGAFENWHPLPPALRPANAVATPNLLGYRIPERLQPEGVSKCENLTFADGHTIAGRIRDCPEITCRVDNYIKSYNHKVKTTPAFPKPQSSNAALGIVKTDGVVASTEKLTYEPVHIESPIALGASATNKCGTYGIKRRRTAQAPGLCYVAANGNALPGWDATINANLHMEGAFAPRIGIDNATLRENLHQSASPGGSRVVRLFEIAKRYTVR